MQIEVRHAPAFALAVIGLGPNEQVKVEPGAMVSFSDGVTAQTQVSGGLFSGIKRVLGGEAFFQNTYQAPPQGGEITLAPTLPGDIRALDVNPQVPLLLQSGSYLAAEAGVTFDTSWGGAKGFFGGQGLLLLKVSGQGRVVFSAYGALEERVLAPGQRYTVDTGHIVAMEGPIQFQVRGMGSLKRTLFSGEGLVCELTGPGRVIMQTRNEQEFVDWLIPKLPSRGSN